MSTYMEGFLQIRIIFEAYYKNPFFFKYRRFELKLQSFIYFFFSFPPFRSRREDALVNVRQDGGEGDERSSTPNADNRREQSSFFCVAFKQTRQAPTPGRRGLLSVFTDSRVFDHV